MLLAAWESDRIVQLSPSHVRLLDQARLEALAAARAETEALSKRLQAQYPDTNKGFAFELVPLPERLVGAIRPVLWMLFAAVGLVLLIASANVANLLLARGAARSRELAIRAALGAGRGRLIRQLLTESLALSLAGAALGALLGAWAVSALPLVAPDDLPRLSEIRLDPLVLLFTLAAGVTTGLVFGVAPALQATRRSLSGAASDASRGSSTRQGRLRGGLVVAEVALAVVVLVGAGLLGRSLQRRLTVEKGFRPEGVLSFHLNVFELGDDAEARARATAEYLAEFRTDVEGFVALEVVESCVGDHREMLPVAGVTYRAFVDPSGGSEDSMTLAVAHKTTAPDKRVIVDAVREVRPPFSPSAVVDDFAVLLKSYRVSKVVGDHYGGEFVKEPFRKNGISYEVCKQPKSDLFRDMLPLLNAGHISLPRHDRLIAQIVGLERRVSRAGRDSIDHAPGGHDDIANAVSGVVASASGVGSTFSVFWV